MADAPGLESLLTPMDVQGFERLEQRKVQADQLPAYARGKVHNRYNDILPSPATRVRLSVEDGDQSTEYINANFVHSADGRRKEYIAAQGPLENTLNRFIRMIWEQGCVAIVMTTNLVEGGKVKCERYWPKEAGFAKQYGDIQVQLRETAEDSGFVRNRLRFVRGSESRDVMHFFYNSWPDHGVPSQQGRMYTRDVIKLLVAVRKYRHATDKFASPLLVHCSAGIGRTGCFVVIDQAFRLIEAHQQVDVLQLIDRDRRERMAFVQRGVQYQFIWNAIAEYARYTLKQRTAQPQGKPEPAVAGKGTRASAVPVDVDGDDGGEGGSGTGDGPPEPKIGATYRTTGPYGNPDGGADVLSFKVGKKGGVWGVGRGRGGRECVCVKERDGRRWVVVRFKQRPWFCTPCTWCSSSCTKSSLSSRAGRRNWKAARGDRLLVAPKDWTRGGLGAAGNAQVCAAAQAATARRTSAQTGAPDAGRLALSRQRHAPRIDTVPSRFSPPSPHLRHPAGRPRPGADLCKAEDSVAIRRVALWRPASRQCWQAAAREQPGRRQPLWRPAVPVGSRHPRDIHILAVAQPLWRRRGAPCKISVRFQATLAQELHACQSLL